MSKKEIALSWSRLSNYRQCPMQFEAKYITKHYPEETENPAFIKGAKVHKQLEDYINFKKTDKNEPVMGNISRVVKPLIDKYTNIYGRDAIFAEQQIALDHDWKSTSWFGKPVDVKYRGIIDMVIFENPKVATVIDFKTGKVRPYDDDYGQLHMTSAFMFELYPELERVNCTYLFAEHKKSITEVFVKEDHKATKAHFDVEYIEVNEDTEFKPKKNEYCFFCGIKEDCIYG